MRVISWNLLRLEGAAVDDVAALLERERPDVLLMQEVTQHMDVLPHKVPGHYHRLPWPGRIHGLAVWSRHNFATPHILPLPGVGAARPPARGDAARSCQVGRHHLRQRPSQPRPAAQSPSAAAHRRRPARQAVGDHRRLQRRRARA
jgi:hypothetical protein